MAVEVEDDVFFADLSKQISMLIMEDEEEFPAHHFSPPLQLQEIPQLLPSHMMTSSRYMVNEVAYRRGSRGTGVFIPKSTAAPPRTRKNRSKRSSTSMEVNSPIQRSAVAAAHVNHSSSSATAMHPDHGCYSSVLRRPK